MFTTHLWQIKLVYAGFGFLFAVMGMFGIAAHGAA